MGQIKQRQEMVHKFFMILIMLGFTLSVGAQITLESNQVQEMIFIYKKEGTNEILLDSISALSIFKEYSCAVDSGKVYVSWSSMTDVGKVYYMNVYQLLNDSLSLRDQFWIEEYKFEELFKKGLKVEFRNDGLWLGFEKGKISFLVLSYSGLNLNTITIVLNKLLKF